MFSLRLSALSFLFLILSACAGGAKEPIAIQWQLYHTAAAPSENLLILLPGINNSLYRFEEEGFFDGIKQYSLNFDVLTVGAEIGHYMQGSLVSELKLRVIPFAKQQGYRKIVLGGISLGGYGSIWFNHEHGDDIRGLLLIAPYLGEAEIISEIAGYSDVGAWIKHRPPVKDDTSISNLSSRVWYWIDEDIQAKKNHTLLAIGDRDKMYPAANLLAQYLTDKQVIIGSGGHNWYSWRRLWSDLLINKNIEKLFQ